jgi:hypothetical protein
VHFSCLLLKPSRLLMVCLGCQHALATAQPYLLLFKFKPTHAG